MNYPPLVSKKLLLVVLALSVQAGPSRAVERPIFQTPRIVTGDSAIAVLASSPKQPQTIEGFLGEVSGLLLYGINGDAPSLRPATWRTEPGKTLQFSLQNDLPCAPAEAGKSMRPDQTNLHVHGLMVYEKAKAEKDLCEKYKKLFAFIHFKKSSKQWFDGVCQ